MSGFRNKSAIVGVGHTGCKKEVPVPRSTLWVRACQEAAQDAGLPLSEVDGIVSLDTSPIPTELAPTPHYMSEALGLDSIRWNGGAIGGPGPGLLAAATSAVVAGVCDVVLVLYTMERQPTPQASPSNNFSFQHAAGNMAYLAPYGYGVFIQWIAAWQRRFQHETGLMREQLGRMVVDQRNMALRNEKAVMKKPLSIDDYMASRWIVEPMCLYDADMPVNVAIAWIVTGADRARDLKQKPVYVANVASWLPPRPDFVFHEDYTDMMIPQPVMERFWRDADLQPKDICFAALHDGFSIYTPYWLQSLGFVGKEDIADFVGSGELGADGRLINNPHGGNLSEGRTQGAGSIVEAVLQLRGSAGERQIRDASNCVVATGGPPVTSAAVLCA